MGILNKEALGCALEKFSESFYKVYLINLTKDSYEVIKVSVDNFFDKVMVNADDLAIKNNRIAILVNLHDLIGKTADISVLY